MKVLYNQVGYAPDDSKPVLLESPEHTMWTECVVIDLDDVVPETTVEPVFVGGVPGWSVGPWWLVDLGEIRRPGRYALRWATAERHGQSEAIVIDPALAHDVVSDVLFYLKGQRCSGIYDVADRAAPRFGDDSVHDVHGGWYDASGDNSKYLSHLSYAAGMDPQQTPLVVWTLARAWHIARASGAHAYFLERLRDEATHGADWLVRMQDPTGFWHITVFDGWSKDPAQRMLSSYRTQSGDRTSMVAAGWRQGGGMAVAALAQCATLDLGGDVDTDTYRESARLGFHHLVEHGDRYRPHGGADDPDDNLIDDTCALLAACELDLVAPEAVTTAELTRRVERLLGRRRVTDGVTWLAADGHGERSWFHASDAGLPIVALNRFADAHGTHRHTAAAAAAALELVEAQLLLGSSRPNPFGYPPHLLKLPGQADRVSWFYPHENPSGYWWQGENARLASLAAAAFGVSAARGGHGEATHTASRWIGWILGANPFDRCMLHGRGRNNPAYQYPYDNAPGGVVNGITSGFDDEADIAFAPAAWRDDERQNWRWGEQWLPHAAWLLYAIVLRDHDAVA